MTKRIHGIVFSYNRAMQLDATLRSFYLHCMDESSIHLTVLFKADTQRYIRQYQTLMKDYQNVTFYSEKNFRRDTLRILTADLFNPFTRVLLQGISYLVNTQHIRVLLFRRVIDNLIHYMQKRIASRKPPAIDTSYILFLVDDNIFVRDFSISEAITALESQPEALGFSLRLGKNTTYCYTRDPRERHQLLPAFFQLNEKVLSFNWKDADHNFGYPLEISSSVYRASMICPLVASLRFHQPNKLEGKMATCSHLFWDTYPRLLCFNTSVTFCNPINKVQKNIPNRAGKSVAFTVDNLAERFSRGERIDVRALDGFIPNGCHQEVDVSLCEIQNVE